MNHPQPRSPITHAALVAVLNAHAERIGIRDGHRHCLCGWRSVAGLGSIPAGNSRQEYREHQAEAILATIEGTPLYPGGETGNTPTPLGQQTTLPATETTGRGPTHPR